MDANTLGAAVPMLGGLDHGDLEKLAAQFEEVEVPAGTVLAKEGDFAYRFFAVLSGTASVTRNRTHLSHFSEGDFFGEAGLQGESTRNATVVATSDMTLASMMSWSFRDMVEHYPKVAGEIEKAMAQRLDS